MRKLLLQKLKLPKVQLSFALIAIYLSAFGQLPFEQYIRVLIVSCVSTILFDLLISYVRIRKLFIPHATMATGMIIAILVDPTLAWYKISSIAFISIAIKNFIRINNKHIFNPAVIGLLLGGYIFGAPVAWWGTSFQYSGNLNIQTLILYIILLSPLYISVYRMRRHFTIVAFFITYILLTLATSGSFSPNVFLTTLLNPTIIFFSIVMLPEPITSPFSRNKQLLFGTSVAFLNFIFASNFIAENIFIPDPPLASLLIANLIFFRR